jgi:hypothetical protein
MTARTYWRFLYSKCNPGWSGTNCKTRDWCKISATMSICGPYGTCALDTTTKLGYKCTCTAGWTGRQCQVGSCTPLPGFTQCTQVWTWPCPISSGSAALVLRFPATGPEVGSLVGQYVSDRLDTFILRSLPATSTTITSRRSCTTSFFRTVATACTRDSRRLPAPPQQWGRDGSPTAGVARAIASAFGQTPRQRFPWAAPSPVKFRPHRAGSLMLLPTALLGTTTLMYAARALA